MPNEPRANEAELKKESDETTFGIEELISCWDEYAAKVPVQKGHLKNTMINCKPALKDHFLFEIIVHNPVQKDALVHESGEILQALRSQLKNGQIQLTVRIDETNEKKLAYTSLEKYEHLHEINSLLSELKNEFDLTLD
jgi:DNA polymerase-3 subunit gamma/tau